MKTVFLAEEPQFILSQSVLTIGNFDGVHMGHRALIHQCVNDANNRGIPSVLLTFWPHPMKVLRSDKNEFDLIYDVSTEWKILSQQGLEYCVVQTFDTLFYQLSAENFLESFLIPRFSPKSILVGHDFTFGKDRSGNILFLKDFCLRKKITLQVIEPVIHKGTRVSSTWIRKLLKEGNMELANEVLVTPYEVNGIVQAGAGRGRTLGVPTANLKFSKLPLRKGVYITEIKVENHSQKYFAITNVGTNPTVSLDDGIKVESHLFDFNENLYNKEIQVSFIQFLRDEVKFSNIEELKNQIHRDLEQARKLRKK